VMIERKGSREWIILRCYAETGSHRIEPNIPGNCVRMIARPEDVIIKESLPQALPGVLTVSKTRFLLQDFDERHEIASGLEALEEKVNVIWHYAISVNAKGELGRFGSKHINKPVSKTF
jgi:hypothetical protein